MKATMSQDGAFRVNLRVEFRLDKEQIATLLAIYETTYGDVGAELTEQEFMVAIKNQLRYSGSDSVEGEVTDEALEWAKEQVEKFWKEQRLH